MVELPESNTESFVRALAKLHQITDKQDRIDNLAFTLTRLSGDEVVLDEVERLIVKLARADVISQDQAFLLLERYLDEKETATAGDDKT